jgi:hypothetical protein
MKELPWYTYEALIVKLTIQERINVEYTRPRSRHRESGATGLGDSKIICRDNQMKGYIVKRKVVDCRSNGHGARLMFVVFGGLMGVSVIVVGVKSGNGMFVGGVMCKCKGAIYERIDGRGLARSILGVVQVKGFIFGNRVGRWKIEAVV